MLDTISYLKKSDFPAIKRNALQTLQVNLGYLCNQQCLHCHVDASPRRKEIMQSDVIELVKEFLVQHDIQTLDLTGGAPEMNPYFRDLVSFARQNNIHVIDRCNLTILEEEGYEWLAGFLSENDIEVVASLPCYLEDNVEAQRGKGVFDPSISGLQKLNSLGYGKGGDGENGKLTLNLVYNPQGAVLSPSQENLEATYKKELSERFGVAFDQLYTITNMPIKRFGSMLLSNDEFEPYMELLKSSHKDSNLETVMCKTLLSVDWQGNVYDCDFNQMLGLPISVKQRHIKDLMAHDFDGNNIAIMDHCYGCTAGNGSSCGGALTE